MEAKNILDYWHDLEFFSPNPVTDSSYSDLTEGVLFPWVQKSDDKCIFKVFAGKISTDELIRAMIKSLHIEDDRIESDAGNSVICALNITSSGYYIENSFNISHFVWASSQVIKSKTLNVELNEDRVNQFNYEINTYLLALNKQLDEPTFKLIFKKVIEELGLTFETNLFTGKFKRKKIEDEQAVDDISTDLFPSFYVEDLKRVRTSVDNSKHLKAYIESQCIPQNEASSRKTNRVEIDKDGEALKKVLSPENYPFGKWPTPFSPSLMQQAAINISLEEKDVGSIFSVNGPPGTGKTTLLKEIIADTIVKRAKVMSKYTTPSEAFTQVALEHPTRFQKHFFEPEDALCHYGMVVASNNNLAVENISCELPLMKSVKDGKSTCFEAGNNEDLYFSDIASTILGEDKATWGLISARLGNKKNISKFTQAFYYGSKASKNRKIRDYFNKTISWTDQKNKFNLKYREVETYRAQIMEAVKRSQSVHAIESNEKEAKRLLDQHQSEMKRVDEALTALNEAIVRIENDIHFSEESIVTIERILPWYVKVFPFLFKSNKKLKEIHDLTEEKLKLNKELREKSTDLREQEKHKRNLSAVIKRAEEKHTLLESELLNIRRQIDADKDTYGKNYTSTEFWDGVHLNKEKQLVCPWVNDAYDKLREELFFEALQLHKAFIVNSEEVKRNINLFANQYDGDLTERDKHKYGHAVMNTLLLCVPVISTTFASVSSFMKYLGANSIGCLILDESGQAKPQASVGAIWRARKTIVVGDPLQVEPILTLPKELMIRFAQKHQVESPYLDRTLSVQQMADNVNAYGGFRQLGDDKLWVGCPLMIHRRSVDTIFTIFNKIAYENRMFNETPNKSAQATFVLEGSHWFDIKGTEMSKSNHYVEAQGAYVAEVFYSYFKTYNKAPNTFIISPFNSVIQGVKRALVSKFRKENAETGTFNEWLSSHIGTVHKFQGKEADEVVLILGCDSAGGRNAANWVGIKPNIINVALSRAKYQFVAIGDTDLWKEVNYVNDIIKHLPVKTHDL